MVFDCCGHDLVGVLSHGKADARLAVLIVVGGPQYRVGSHRSFVFLARAIAAKGIPVLRFDMRGMGDSEGERPGNTESVRDVGTAVDTLFQAVESLDGVVLLGLCDGATASILYARSDPRVLGLVLLNPWIRSSSDLRQRNRSFFGWPGLTGRHGALRFPSLESKHGLQGSRSSRLSAVWGVMRRALERRRVSTELATEVTKCLLQFDGEALVLISGRDSVGREFLEHSKSRGIDNSAKRNFQLLPDAKHTFPSRKDLGVVGSICVAWLERLSVGVTQRLLSRHNRPD